MHRGLESQNAPQMRTNMPKTALAEPPRGPKITIEAAPRGGDRSGGGRPAGAAGVGRRPAGGRASGGGRGGERLGAWAPAV